MKKTLCDKCDIVQQLSNYEVYVSIKLFKKLYASSHISLKFIETWCFS